MPDRSKSSVEHFARCPEHGLHGQRDRCFICNGPVEQVPMLHLDDYEIANLRALLQAVMSWNGTHPSGIPGSPLNAAHSGDWTGQLLFKLPEVEHRPNMDARALAENARNWKPLR